MMGMLLLMVAPWLILTLHWKTLRLLGPGRSGGLTCGCSTKEPQALPHSGPRRWLRAGPQRDKGQYGSCEVNGPGLEPQVCSGLALGFPFPHHSPVSSPSRGSLARPSCPMMYCGRSVLMPWPSRAWPSAASSR